MADPPAILDAVPIDEERSPESLRRRRQIVARDATRCFNHQDTDAGHTCAACGERFCDGCIVVLQGEPLCGPCKNFRIRGWQRPARFSALAIVAFIGALLTGPLGLCLLSLGAGFKAPALGFLGVVPPFIVLLLGVRALRDVETNPHLRGRALAITAVVTALVGAIFMALLPIVVQRGIE